MSIGPGMKKMISNGSTMNRRNRMSQRGPPSRPAPTGPPPSHGAPPIPTSSSKYYRSTL